MNELKTLETDKGLYDSFLDQTAREQITKIPVIFRSPISAQVGYYLRAKAVEDGVVTELEAVPAPEGGNGGSSITIDPTLTQPGQAADAKATGDAISKLSQQNVDLPDNLVYYVPDEVDSGGDEEGGAANGSTVTVEQILTSGVEVAKITVDGEETTIYAPEASTGGGGSGGGGSAGTPDFSLVFSTTTTEELGSIPVNLDLSPYSEILGFIKTLPADGKSTGHITWSMANAAGCFCYINSSIHATQERIHRLHITRYTNNNWFGDMSYAIPSAASVDTFRGCLLSGTRLNTVGSYMGGVALKIGTTVEIYAR